MRKKTGLCEESVVVEVQEALITFFGRHTASESHP